jgi:hypothetical protein
LANLWFLIIAVLQVRFSLSSHSLPVL